MAVVSPIQSKATRCNKSQILLYNIMSVLATPNHFHNILRLFDVLPNFPFTTSETMGDYYL